jgi:hypothetical protein
MNESIIPFRSGISRFSRGTPTFQCMNPNAAGVDIGAMEIYIAVPADRDPQPVRCFSTFTEDLHTAADWLKASMMAISINTYLPRI